MEKKFKYVYDPQSNILYKYYYNEINIRDIHSSWDYAIKKNLIPKGTKRFILDYTKANFNISIKETSKIAEYYYEHLDIFKDARIAIITQNQQDVIIPTFVETKDKGYQSKPFYTEEAAIQWVKKIS